MDTEIFLNVKGRLAHAQPPSSPGLPGKDSAAEAEVTHGHTDTAQLVTLVWCWGFHGAASQRTAAPNKYQHQFLLLMDVQHLLLGNQQQGGKHYFVMQTDTIGIVAYAGLVLALQCAMGRKTKRKCVYACVCTPMWKVPAEVIAIQT